MLTLVPKSQLKIYKENAHHTALYIGRCIDRLRDIETAVYLEQFDQDTLDNIREMIIEFQGVRRAHLKDLDEL